MKVVTEIRWTLHVAETNISINANKDVATIMKLMFPESKIAENLKLSEYYFFKVCKPYFEPITSPSVFGNLVLTTI